MIVRIAFLPRLLVSWLLLVSAAQAESAEVAAEPPETVVELDGKPTLPMHGATTGFWLFAHDEHAQLVMLGHPARTAVASLDGGRRMTIRVPGRLPSPAARSSVAMQLVHVDGGEAEVTLRLASGQTASAKIKAHDQAMLQLAVPRDSTGELSIEIVAPRAAASIRLARLQQLQDGRAAEMPWRPRQRSYPQTDAVACSPAFRPAVEQVMIEWDWRCQDGIENSKAKQTYAQAANKTLARGELLLHDLEAAGLAVKKHREAWKSLAARVAVCQRDPDAAAAAWEELWLDVHRARRELVLANPLADVGPVLFVKHVPSTMSHQLTQYYGYEARPGGGVFLLPEPGRSMRVRRLGDSLPEGNYMHPEVSYDGKRILFAFCDCAAPPKQRRETDCFQRRYHLYQMNSDGTQVKRLTDGDYDDFSPKFLPSEKLLFVSTRRGGFHRCGRGPCYVYTLALAEPDGSNPRPISFHETNEWDPSVLHDGRVVYTRWDYVDRNAVFYQQLWSVWQDGADVRIYFGNNSYNPVGTWEARPVPGSNKVMATAAPHHGMTAGSIVLIDVSQGVDGPGPITRLTPDALFPESETGLAHGITVDQPIRFDDELKRTWGPQPQAQATRRTDIPEEELRWPGHCYRSPYPLSEKYFLAAYSYDRLRGEPGANRPNMFGLYFCDAFGNKELLYRDPNIASQWPIPLRPHAKPPVLEMRSQWAGNTAQKQEGTFFLKNVRQSWPRLPEVEIRQLRILQVLPKTTPHANQPRVGAANASPGKQVLGTVPVERDGSAYFRVPARTPVMFQALDAQGRAVQTMRSLTYLQPGEQVSCVGCHEPRTNTVLEPSGALAATREPSIIVPGPDGSRPFSYPILVQPVLDRHCVRCHNPEKPEGKIVLTGHPDKQFSQSYNALVRFTAYSAWGAPNNNYEPLTAPDTFGARASKLTRLLDGGHYDVRLSAEDWERITTWMDANALFFGTFNPELQARQLHGERIAGPDLE